MKKWILHILLVGVLGILAASCSQEADDPTVDSRGEKEKVLIRFTIALDEPKAASRTSWDGYDPDPDDSNYSDGPQAEDDTEYMEIGSVAENYINPSTVQVLIYDMNGTPMGELKEVTVKRDTGDDNNNQHLYDLTGAFEADADQISSLDFKLMVFANTPKKSDLNNPDTWQFAYPLADGAGIPMWGIATFTGVDLSGRTSEGNAAELSEPIYMLRSMAKIEVTLNSEANGGYTLKSVTLNKAMKNGLVMPKLRTDEPADVTIKGLESTEALGVEEVFNPSDGDVGEASFTESESENTYYIYVPEYDASSNGNLEIKLALTNGTKDETGDDKITNKSFIHGGYSEGAYSEISWNVVRNHYYKYTVSVQNGVDLVVIITINPWNYRDVTYKNTPLT